MQCHRTAPEMVNACMQMGAARPMGPITLLDYNGLDLAVAIGDVKGHDILQVIRDRVEMGAFGKKTRSGLYPARRYAERTIIG
jgi:3-hydroxyacyl-CoA dehydrogenase